MNMDIIIPIIRQSPIRFNELSPLSTFPKLVAAALDTLRFNEFAGV